MEKSELVQVLEQRLTKNQKVVSEVMLNICENNDAIAKAAMVGQIIGVTQESSFLKRFIDRISE